MRMHIRRLWQPLTKQKHWHLVRWTNSSIKNSRAIIIDSLDHWCGTPKCFHESHGCSASPHRPRPHTLQLQTRFGPQGGLPPPHELIPIQMKTHKWKWKQRSHRNSQLTFKRRTRRFLVTSPRTKLIASIRLDLPLNKSNMTWKICIKVGHKSWSAQTI